MYTIETQTLTPSKVKPILIYCADGNPRFAKIAIDNGFEYGVQVPRKNYFPIYFADQNWKRPNREKYMAGIARLKPEMCTVLDLEKEEQYDEVLDWATEAAQYVNKVIIIPKVTGIIARLPREISGKEVVLGYSVPTSFGSTPISLDEFTLNWKVHLLGGNPNRQIAIWAKPNIHVYSVDSNFVNMIATHGLKYWSAEGVRDYPFGYRDAMYEAFDLSCKNLQAAWDDPLSVDRIHKEMRKGQTIMFPEVI